LTGELEIGNPSQQGLKPNLIQKSDANTKLEIGNPSQQGLKLSWRNLSEPEKEQT